MNVLKLGAVRRAVQLCKRGRNADAKKDWKVENAVERQIDGIHETVMLMPAMNLKLNLTSSDFRRMNT